MIAADSLVGDAELLGDRGYLGRVEHPLCLLHRGDERAAEVGAEPVGGKVGGGTADEHELRVSVGQFEVRPILLDRDDSDRERPRDPTVEG